MQPASAHSPQGEWGIQSGGPAYFSPGSESQARFFRALLPAATLLPGINRLATQSVCKASCSCEDGFKEGKGESHPVWCLLLSLWQEGTLPRGPGRACSRVGVGQQTGAAQHRADEVGAAPCPGREGAAPPELDVSRAGSSVSKQGRGGPL